LQRLAASLTSGGFAVHVLEEPVGEVIFRSFPSGWLYTFMTAMRADKFDHVFLGIPVQSCPTGIANSYDVF
jgi:hypothetical protein